MTHEEVEEEIVATAEVEEEDELVTWVEPDRER